MKTQLQQLKNKLSSFTKVMMVGALIFLSVNSNAQPAGSCNAFFFPWDSLGYAHFSNNSIPQYGISLWDFGDGSTGTSIGDANHFYNQLGTYYVCLTVIDTINNCTDTYCDSIQTGGGTPGGCSSFFFSSVSGSVATFNDLSMYLGPMTTYYWDFGDGNSSSILGNVSHTYVSNGTYYVCLTISDSATNCYDTYCDYVTIGNPMGGTCSAYFNLVQDSTNLYNYTAYSYASAGMLYSYFWDFGDGTTSNLQYPSHTYAGSGPYVLCLTITDNASCTAIYCDSLYAGRGGNGIVLNV
ncbi:MAG: PKD domain-containing protein, partial [Bacteroidia bacterium]|nr:PKD domain-containing protein [Bacteroidia bacterium]